MLVGYIVADDERLSRKNKCDIYLIRVPMITRHHKNSNLIDYKENC